jgi:toxin ParE1/3/4
VTTARLRPLAEEDLVERTRYYREHGGHDLGARFFDSAIATIRAIEAMPGIGSPHIGEQCGIDGLRVRRLHAFPCGWFYFERPDHVDVVRLLADAQDLPSLLDSVE